MKKILLTLALLSLFSANAAERLHVSAMDDFSSVNPSESFRVKLLEDSQMSGIFMLKGDIIHCSLDKVTDVKRLKRDAKAYFNILAYEDVKGKHDVSDKLIGQYAKRVLNKEEIKKIPPKNVVKKTAGVVGDYFLTGISKGISFVDGMIENKEDNRFKSGAKRVYEDSLLSYVEYGEEIDIKIDDTFYLVVKEKKEKDIIEETKEEIEVSKKETKEEIENKVEEIKKEVVEIKEEVKEVKEEAKEEVKEKVGNLIIEDDIEIVISDELRKKIEELDK